MLNTIDFSLVKKTLLWTASVVFISMMILLYAYYQSAQNEQALLQTQQTLSNLDQQIEALKGRQRLIARFENDFKLIEQHHFLQTEHRLAWIEQIKKSTKALKLSNLNYLIDPQQKLETGSTLELFHSAMTLTTSLVHEGDLIKLLQDIDDPQFGIHAITQCEMERKADPQNTALPENFTTVCEIGWFTAKPYEPVVFDPDNMDGMI